MPSLYPAFNVVLPAADDFNGRSLSHFLRELDEIAASTALVALSKFIDARTMALEVLDEDQLPASCPPVQWYPAQEGLSTVRGLLLSLRSLERLSQQQNEVVEGLERFATLLEEAEDKNAKFHLLIDI